MEIFNPLVKTMIDTDYQNQREIYAEVMNKVQNSGNDLQILHDPNSFTTLLKFYQKFINESDLRGMPSFLVEVDNLLKELGGKPKQNVDPQEDKEQGEKEQEKEQGEKDNPFNIKK